MSRIIRKIQQTPLRIGETQRLASIGARQDLGQVLNQPIESGI
ncbi:hypothetical protein ACO1KB_00505 [Leptospira interrogans serovar Szwajizak]|nr:hypothetical protein [Leptospira interrogans]